LRRYDLDHDDIEAMWIQINNEHLKPFVLGFIYRPPQCNNDWVKQFNIQLKLLEDLYLEAHFLGDFNINFSQTDIHGNFTNKTWQSVVAKRDYKQLINAPTRVTSLSSSTIDHIYSNRPELIIETNVPQYAISDHLPVCFTRFSGSKMYNNKHTYITYRSFRNFSEEKFKCE